MAEVFHLLRWIATKKMPRDKWIRNADIECVLHDFSEYFKQRTPPYGKESCKKSHLAPQVAGALKHKATALSKFDFVAFLRDFHGADLDAIDGAEDLIWAIACWFALYPFSTLSDPSALEIDDEGLFRAATLLTHRGKKILSGTCMIGGLIHERGWTMDDYSRLLFLSLASLTPPASAPSSTASSRHNSTASNRSGWSTCDEDGDYTPDEKELGTILDIIVRVQHKPVTETSLPFNRSVLTPMAERLRANLPTAVPQPSEVRISAETFRIFSTIIAAILEGSGSDNKHAEAVAAAAAMDFRTFPKNGGNGSISYRTFVEYTNNTAVFEALNDLFATFLAGRKESNPFEKEAQHN